MFPDTDPEKAAECLRDTIKMAFPDVTFAEPITGVDGLPNEELDEEQALYGALRGKKWSQVPLSVVAANPDGVVLLTDEAFAAFLPAWLNYATTHTKIQELMVYVFSPVVQKSMEMMDRRIGLLSAPQKEALRAFLSYCVMIELSNFREEAQHALAYVVGLSDEQRHS
jgi:hypothetical protein